MDIFDGVEAVTFGETLGGGDYAKAMVCTKATEAVVLYWYDMIDMAFDAGLTGESTGLSV